MKIILLGLAACVFTVVLLGVVGLLFPATRTASARRDLAAPPARVWTLLTDLAGQPGWRPGLASVQIIEAATGREHWIEQPRRGPKIEFRTTRQLPGVLWEFTFSGPAEGRWSGRLESLPENRTRVVVEETATVGNPWKRLLARLFFDPQAMADGYLAQLAAAAENTSAN